MEVSGRLETRASTIVVIDDDVEFFKSLRLLLSFIRRGLHILFFEESQLALNSLELQKADLIITDLQGSNIMPFQEFRQALQSTFNRQTPIVRMSGNHNLRMIDGEGSIAFLPKPIDMNRLEKIMNEVLGSAS